MSGRRSKAAELRAWSDPVERIVGDWSSARPGIDPAPIRVIGRIVRLEDIIARRLRAAFARHDLDSGLFDVLAALRRAGDPYRLSPTELAHLTMVTTGGITGRIDRLTVAGLVDREGASDDRRKTYVRLTALGLETVDRALDELLEVECSLLAGLTKDRVETLAQGLAELERSIEAAQE